MRTVFHCIAAAVLTALSVGVHAQQQATPNDAQIAAIVVTANQVDIDAGKLAAGRTHTNDVKQFAKLMVQDHSSVNRAAAALAHKLDLTPEQNDTSRALQQGGDENLAHLKMLKGAQFDKAYVDHEVAYHQAVLDAVDKTLIPSAQNPDLKALLVKVRPTFVAHLEHARHLQSELSNHGS